MNIYPYWVLRNLLEGSETESVSGEEFPDWTSLIVCPSQLQDKNLTRLVICKR